MNNEREESIQEDICRWKVRLCVVFAGILNKRKALLMTSTDRTRSPSLQTSCVTATIVATSQKHELFN